VLQCFSLQCSALQWVAVCCSVLQYVTFAIQRRPTSHRTRRHVSEYRYGKRQCGAARCSVLQCAAVCCSVLQCAAVCCSVWQYVTFVIQRRPTSHRTRRHVSEYILNISDGAFCLNTENMYIICDVYVLCMLCICVYIYAHTCIYIYIRIETKGAVGYIQYMCRKNISDGAFCLNTLKIYITSFPYINDIAYIVTSHIDHLRLFYSYSHISYKSLKALLLI